MRGQAVPPAAIAVEVKEGDLGDAVVAVVESKVELRREILDVPWC